MVEEAIWLAEAVLPGDPDDDDTRWQAIIEVGVHCEDEPETVWGFVRNWGAHPMEDLRTAIATCVLEHLLEYDFDLIFPRVEELVSTDSRFADTFCGCWKFGQSNIRQNSERFDALMAECRTISP